MLKSAVLNAFRLAHADRIFHYVNRGKLLVLAYHGVSANRFGMKCDVLLPLAGFAMQIEYLSRACNVISLRQAADCLSKGCGLPDNPAVITFDDGYRNNLTLALPVLEHYGVPATIFLTAGFIGSERVLPLDELFLIIENTECRTPIVLPQMGLGPFQLDTRENRYKTFLALTDRLKKTPIEKQEQTLGILRDLLGVDCGRGKVEGAEEFAMLSWEEVCRLAESRSIELGAHTVHHSILTNLDAEQAKEEILSSRFLIEKATGLNVSFFAYPNGKETDYGPEHVQCLKDAGFDCAVTTVPKLNQPGEDIFRLGRFCVGPDFAKEIGEFALKVSGFVPTLKEWMYQGSVRY